MGLGVGCVHVQKRYEYTIVLMRNAGCWAGDLHDIVPKHRSPYVCNVHGDVILFRLYPLDIAENLCRLKNQLSYEYNCDYLTSLMMYSTVGIASLRGFRDVQQLLSRG